MSSASAIPDGRGTISRCVMTPLLVTIKNFWELRHVYGSALVQRLPTILHARARAAGIAKQEFLRVEENRFLLLPNVALSHDEDVALCLSELALAKLGGTPIKYGPWSVLVDLGVEDAEEGGRARNQKDARPAPDLLAGSSLRQDDGWRDAYAAAMDDAAGLYSGLVEGNLAFAFQSIVGCNDPERQLYQEALLRVQGEDGEARSAGGPLASLERLRLIRHIDYCAVKAILGLLEASPSMHLGCNISAESAVEDAWWATVFRQLQADPGLAGRMVIEITEGARIPDVAAALAFIRRLQAFGCRIAIDDFGSGFTSLDFVVRARPDIIKIDSDYLKRGRECKAAREVFQNLVKLAASIAGDVVLEGVETCGDLHLIEESSIGNRGNIWVQGWLPGRPALLPAWHASSPCVLAASVPSPIVSAI